MQTSRQNAQRHPAVATTRCCICILQQAFNDSRKESKIVRRVQQVMNILPSFSPYPSSSLPLTKTGKKGTARDNEQKKSKIMVACPRGATGTGEDQCERKVRHDTKIHNDQGVGRSRLLAVLHRTRAARPRDVQAGGLRGPCGDGPRESLGGGQSAKRGGRIRKRGANAK